MRRNYIDNIKLTCILLLFPYHTAMIWNNFGSGFYVFGGENEILSSALFLFFPILMPMLFALAGVTMHFSLEKRTSGEFLQERLVRLAVPTLSGVLLVVPFITFFAEKFNNGFSGNYFQQYITYFSKAADENGYTGGFGLANFWFLIYLFEISIIALAVVALVKWLAKTLKFKVDIGNLPFVAVILMFVFPWLLTPVLEIMGGKSLMKFFALFLLGYYLLSKEKIVKKCEKYRFYTLSFFIVLEITLILLYLNFNYSSGFFFNGLASLSGWIGILAFLGLAKHGFDFTNKILSYLCKQSFSIYIFHQAILVAVGYFVLVYLNGLVMPLQFVVILAASFFLTVLFCEIIRHIPILREIFGIKSRMTKMI